MERRHVRDAGGVLLEIGIIGLNSEDMGVKSTFLDSSNSEDSNGIIYVSFKGPANKVYAGPVSRIIMHLMGASITCQDVFV